MICEATGWRSAWAASWSSGADVPVQRAGVRGRHALDRDGGDQVEDEVQLGAPAAVDGGLADARAPGDALDRHPGEADRRQLLEDGAADGLGHVLAQHGGSGGDAAAGSRVGGHGVECIGRNDETVAFRRGHVLLSASRRYGSVPAFAMVPVLPSKAIVVSQTTAPPTTPAVTDAASAPLLPVHGPGELAALAARHGLTVSGARPALREYVRQLWGRRHFITAFATAKLTAQYSQAKLGQLWQVMTPLLNAAVYYFIFGLLMGTKQNVAGLRPVPGHRRLHLHLHPELGHGGHPGDLRQPGPGAGAALPARLAADLVRAAAAPAAAVLDGRAGRDPARLRAVPPACRGCWSIPALVLQFVFNTGLAMVMARLGAKTPDLAQLMPFILRTWMYASGVMCSIDDAAQRASTCRTS